MLSVPHAAFKVEVIFCVRGVISPLLSNIYLNPLDHLMVAAGWEMIRYADDFVVLCGSKAEAERALAVVQQWTVTAGLTLHPEKTRIVDATQAGGFDFLGYHFERGQRRPRGKSLKKFKDAIRAQTKRNNGQSLQVIIAKVNRTTKGWFGYFKHSHRYTFEPLDPFIRMRLRSILRCRSGRRGIASAGTCPRGRSLQISNKPGKPFVFNSPLFCYLRGGESAEQNY
jgi:RNA-directed DNA polymerase